MLVAVPIVGAVLAAGLLGRRGPEATSGAIAAVTATLLLVMVLFFVTFRLVTPELAFLLSVFATLFATAAVNQGTLPHARPPGRRPRTAPFPTRLGRKEDTV